MIGLVDHHDLEALFRRQIDLLRLRDFLQQFLHDGPIVVAHI